jgi:putative SOS response-associated peptidase YedK
VCGRYVSTRSANDLVAEFDALFDMSAGAVELPPDQNVAPTKDVYAVVETAAPSRPGPGEAVPNRELRIMRWGLVPSWAPDRSIASRLINARLETVAEKPAFRRAFAARRCLLPADGYFEWRAGSAGTSRAGRRTTIKQPYLIRPKDGGVLAMAGLWERWRDRARPRDDPAAWLETCTIITTVAEEALGHIHDRMPVFLPRDRWAAWLAPEAADLRRLEALLTPEPGQLVAVPVSTAVNDVRNNGPHLLTPLPATAPSGLTAAADADFGADPLF